MQLEVGTELETYAFHLVGGGPHLGVGWMCSKIYLLCYAALFQKSTFYALRMRLLCSNYASQESTRLCTNIMWAAFTCFRSVEQAGHFFGAPVCGGAFTLTFHFHVNSDCVGARSWLSKDVGEAVSCELLPGTWDSLIRLLVTITESPRGQVSTNFN